MDDNFSPKVRDVITFSKEEALRLGHDFIGTEHLLLGLIRKGDGKAIEILVTFQLVNTSEEVEYYARQYFNIRIYAAPATLLLYVFMAGFSEFKMQKFLFF